MMGMKASSQMFRSKFKNPLEKLLTERSVSSKLPSMGGPKMPRVGRLGQHENQPKIKPLAHGFKHNFFG